MSFKTTLRLLVAVILLGGIVWVLNYSAPDGTRRAAEAGLLPPFRHEIHRLELFREDSQLVLERDADGWLVVHPLRVRADAGVVRSLIALLESLPRLDTITAGQMQARELGRHDYGLDEAAPRLRIVAEDLDFTLHLGGLSPFGEQLFVRCGNEADVVATDAILWQALPENLLAVINRRVFRGSRQQWVRLDIHREGAPFLQLSRNADGWSLQQPIAARAGRAAVEGLLAELEGMEIIDYVWEVAAEESTVNGYAVPVFRDAETYGLTRDDAKFRVRLWMEGSDVSQDLLLGRVPSGTPDRIYAMQEGEDAVFMVAAEISKPLSVGISDLRERRLFRINRHSVNRVILQSGDVRSVMQLGEDNRWMLNEPQHARADNETVRNLLDGILRIEARDFLESEDYEKHHAALERPWLGITLESGSAEKPDVAGMLIGRPDTNGISVAVLPERKLAVRLNAEALPFSMEHPVLPQAFLDRTIMSLYPQNIMRIGLKTGDYKYEMMRDEEQDGWVTAGGDPVNSDLLDELLFFAAHVRAADIATLNPDNLKKYGLDAGFFEITYGLAGDGGIKRIIFIGALLPDQGGYYARLQGVDMVFVLSREVVQRVTGGLLAGPEK